MSTTVTHVFSTKLMLKITYRETSSKFDSQTRGNKQKYKILTAMPDEWVIIVDLT